MFDLSAYYVPSVLWYCWLGLLTCKNRLPYNLYCVGGDVKHCSIQSWWFGAVGNRRYVDDEAKLCWDGSTRQRKTDGQQWRLAEFWSVSCACRLFRSCWWNAVREAWTTRPQVGQMSKVFTATQPDAKKAVWRLYCEGEPYQRSEYNLPGWLEQCCIVVEMEKLFIGDIYRHV